MKSCLTLFLLLISTPLLTFAVNCPADTFFLNDTRKMVKFDEFFQDFQPKQTYSYIERRHAARQELCIESKYAASTVNVRMNWFEEVGMLKIQYASSCLVFTLRKDEAGYLEVVRQLYNMIGREAQIFGFYMDQESRQRVLHWSWVQGYFYFEYWPVKYNQSLAVDGRTPECNSTVLDEYWLPSSNGGNLSVKEGAQLNMLCGFVGVLAAIAVYG